MQFSLYAFIPLGVLAATALAAAAISLWHGSRRRDLACAVLVLEKQPHSAEIIEFPSRRRLLPAEDLARLRHGNS